MFIWFNVVGFAAQWIARRRGMAKFKSTGVGALAMIGLFAASFLYTVISTWIIPARKSTTCSSFSGICLE